MIPRARAGSLGAWAAAAAILIAGCGGGADEGPDPPADETVAAGDTSAGDAAPAAEGNRPDVEPDTVNVRLTEYRIQMPRTLPPGPVVLRVTNAGAVEHNLELRGEGPTGLREKFARNLHPTQTRDLQITLESGTYKVFCPVGGHQRRGGVLLLEVREAAAAGGSER